MEEERGLKMIVILLLKLLEGLLFPLSALVKIVDSALAPPNKFFTSFASCRGHDSRSFRNIRVFVRIKRFNGIYVYFFRRAFTDRISNFVHLVDSIQDTSV